MATVQQVYIAIYGRPADPEGLAFWNEQTNNGADLSSMINAFTAGPEYEARFEGMSNEEIITSIYQALFGREPDAEGLAFYLEALAEGDLSIGTIAIGILDGAQGNDQQIIENKTEAANSFTESLDTPEEQEAYQGPDAAAFGENYLNTVNEDPDSVPSADEADQDITEFMGPGEGQTPGEEEEAEEDDGGWTPPADTTPPTLEINVDGNVKPNNTTPVTFTFSEAVTGFELSDIEPAGGDVTDLVRVSSTTYMATFTADSSEGAASISVGAGSYADRAGNEGEAASVDLIVSDNSVSLWDDAGNFVGSYAGIQEAIDAADANYVVNVAEGIYTGDVSIDDVENLTINGIGATIEGGIKVLAGATGATIDGFTITKSLSDNNSSVFVRAHDVTISNNNFNGTDIEVSIETVHNINGLTIEGNTITGNTKAAIYLNPTDTDSGNSVTNNIFNDNNVGVAFETGPSASGVSGNTFNNSTLRDIEVVFRSEAVSVDLSDIITGNTFSGDDIRDVVVFGAGGSTITATDTGSYINTYFHSDTAVTLNGGDGADTLIGGNGDDTVYSGTGNDEISGGDGDDLLVSWADVGESAILIGGNGSDLIAAGGGGSGGHSAPAGDGGTYLAFLGTETTATDGVYAEGADTATTDGGIGDKTWHPLSDEEGGHVNRYQGWKGTHDVVASDAVDSFEFLVSSSAVPTPFSTFGYLEYVEMTIHGFDVDQDLIWFGQVASGRDAAQPTITANMDWDDGGFTSGALTIGVSFEGTDTEFTVNLVGVQNADGDTNAGSFVEALNLG